MCFSTSGCMSWFPLGGPLLKSTQSLLGDLHVRRKEVNGENPTKFRCVEKAPPKKWGVPFGVPLSQPETGTWFLNSQPNYMLYNFDVTFPPKSRGVLLATQLALVDCNTASSTRSTKTKNQNNQASTNKPNRTIQFLQKKQAKATKARNTETGTPKPGHQNRTTETSHKTVTEPAPSPIREAVPQPMGTATHGAEVPERPDLGSGPVGPGELGCGFYSRVRLSP